MKPKRFLGFCIPVMITTAAMSAIAFPVYQFIRKQEDDMEFL